MIALTLALSLAGEGGWTVQGGARPPDELVDSRQETGDGKCEMIRRISPLTRFRFPVSGSLLTSSL
jgi:hypothetical protein